MEEIRFTTDLPPASGRLLISEPTLGDEHFQRTVVYLCSHNNEGSHGFVLNRSVGQSISNYVPDIDSNEHPLFVGGPVGMDSIYFVHRWSVPVDGQLVADNIYFGGAYKDVFSAINQGVLGPSEILFFLGYSGWSSGQLAAEIKQGSWLVAETDPDFLFEQPRIDIWEAAILRLDEKYHPLVKMPLNPNLN